MRPFAPQTAAGSFPYRGDGNIVVAYGLAGAEKIRLTIYNGVSYQPYVDEAGVQLELTATKTNLTIPGDLHAPIQFVKDATAAAAGVAVY